MNKSCSDKNIQNNRMTDSELGFSGFAPVSRRKHSLKLKLKELLKAKYFLRSHWKIAAEQS